LDSHNWSLFNCENSNSRIEKRTFYPFPPKFHFEKAAQFTKNRTATLHFPWKKRKNGKGIRLYGALFLLCSLFLLSFGSFRHDIDLETNIVSNLYLKFTNAVVP